MRALRILALVFAILVVIAVAAVAVITQLVDANRFKPQIEAAVRDATGQPLQLRGNIKLSFFPWLALQSEQGEFAPPLARWQSMSVRARLVPLLRGQLRLDRIRFGGLVLQLQKNADGTNNWSRLFAPRQRTSAPNTSAQLAGFDVTSATIDYRDLGSGTHYRAENLQVTSGAYVPGTPLDLRIAADLRLGTPAAAAGPPNLHATIAARWLMSGGKMSVSALQATGVLHAAGLSSTGVGWQFAAPSTTYELATANLALPSGAANLAGFRVALSNAQLQAGASASGAVHITTDGLRDSLRNLGVTLPATTDPNVLGALTTDFTFALRGGAWSIADLALNIDATRLHGSVSAGTSAISFTLRGDHIGLDRYLPPVSVPAKPWEFPAAALRDLQAEGSVQFDQAGYQGYTLRNAKLELVLRDGTVRSVAPQAAPQLLRKHKRKP